jgi:hypothetical protein
LLSFFALNKTKADATLRASANFVFFIYLQPHPKPPRNPLLPPLQKQQIKSNATGKQ